MRPVLARAVDCRSCVARLRPPGRDPGRARRARASRRASCSTPTPTPRRASRIRTTTSPRGTRAARAASTCRARARAGSTCSSGRSTWARSRATAARSARRSSASTRSGSSRASTRTTWSWRPTSASIRRGVAQGKLVSLMGVEGGHMIEGKLSVLRDFYRLGVRYMTLTHSFHLDWADSAGTGEPMPPGIGGLERVRRGGRPRDEPARHDGRRLARLRRHVPRRAGGVAGAGDRVALVVPRGLRPPAQPDRRHAARARREGRRGDDQLLPRLQRSRTPRR